MKKILITGATGFLGSHLTHALVKQGYQVIILKRQTSKLNRIETLLPDLVAYDVDTVELSRPFLEQGKIDAVIHTATCYGRNSESVSDIFKTNTIFPLKLLEVATAFGTETFFNTDTILDKYLNAYALSKKHFLEWGKHFAGEKKIRFVNIRLEHFYGGGDDESKFATYVIKNCLANVPELKLTLGEQQRDFIYIADVVSAYQLLLQKSTQTLEWFQEYDLGSGHAVSIREFVETVHRITQSKTYLNFGALPYRKNEVMQSEANIAPLKQLGWSCQTSLTEGIKTIIQQGDYIRTLIAFNNSIGGTNIA